MINIKFLDRALKDGYAYNHSAHIITFPPGTINVMILKKTGAPDINLKYISRDARVISSLLSKYGNGSLTKKYS